MLSVKWPRGWCALLHRTYEPEASQKNIHNILQQYIDGLEQDCRLTPLLMHCSYCSLALSHRYLPLQDDLHVLKDVSLN